MFRPEARQTLNRGKIMDDALRRDFSDFYNQLGTLDQFAKLPTIRLLNDNESRPWAVDQHGIVWPGRLVPISLPPERAAVDYIRDLLPSNFSQRTFRPVAYSIENQGVKPHRLRIISLRC